MARNAPADDHRSSAIDTGSGKLEVRNEHSIIQVEGVISQQSTDSTPQNLIRGIRLWCEAERASNQQTKGEYRISWRKLIALMGDNEHLKEMITRQCDEFRKYLEDVQSGAIVPTPTPPPTATIQSERGKVNGHVASIYRRQRLLTERPEPADVDTKKAKVGDTGEK